jgi:hypothetical protein
MFFNSVLRMVCRWCDTKVGHLVKQGRAHQAKSGGCSSRNSELPTGALACPIPPSAIPVNRFPLVLKLQILSSNSPAPGLTFYPLDPLSDVGRTILEFDTIGLAPGEKIHRALIDECHIPQIQYQVLPRSLEGEQLSEFLDIFCFNTAAEREYDSAVC